MSRLAEIEREIFQIMLEARLGNPYVKAEPLAILKPTALLRARFEDEEPAPVDVDALEDAAFARDPTLFWLDPARWDHDGTNNRSDPGCIPFWERAARPPRPAPAVRYIDEGYHGLRIVIPPSRDFTDPIETKVLREARYVGDMPANFAATCVEAVRRGQYTWERAWSMICAMRIEPERDA